MHSSRTTSEKLRLHAHHLLAFPRLKGAEPLETTELNQLRRELAMGLYMQNEWPSMTLSVGPQGEMIPETKAFKTRLIGHLLAQLNNYLSGFIHGGLIHPQHWTPEDRPVTMDESTVIDVKAFFKTHHPEIPYQSLHERLHEAKLLCAPQETPTQANDQWALKFNAVTPGFTLEFQQHDPYIENDVVHFNPQLVVHYKPTIPHAYKTYLDGYLRENGEYPRDFALFHEVCTHMQHAIVEQLPVLCSSLIYTLSVIQGIASYDLELKKAHKMPQFSVEPMVSDQVVPLSCPPLFARTVKDITLTEDNQLVLRDIFSALLQSDMADEFRAIIAGMRYRDEFDEALQAQVQIIASTLIEKQRREQHDLPPLALAIDNDTLFQVTRFIRILIEQYSTDHHQRIEKLIDVMNDLASDFFDPFELDTEQSTQSWVSIQAQIRQFLQECVDVMLQKAAALAPEDAETKQVYTEYWSTWQQQILLSIQRINDALEALEAIFSHVDKAWDTLTYTDLSAMDEAFHTTQPSLCQAKTQCQFQKSTFTEENALKLKAKTACIAQALPNATLASTFQALDGDVVYDVFKQDVKAQFIIDDAEFHALFFSLNPTNEQLCSFERQELHDFLFEKSPTIAIPAHKKNPDMQTILHVALLMKPSFPRFKALVERYPDLVKIPDRLGQLPVHAATALNCPLIVEYLLNCDPLAIKYKTRFGYTVLHFAAEYGSTDLCTKLLARDPEPNRRIPNGYSALYLAIVNKKTETALALLSDARVDLHLALVNQQTPLFLALEQSLEPLVLTLIERGACLETRRLDDGFDALCVAGKAGASFEVMNRILEKKLLDKQEAIAFLVARQQELQRLIAQDAALEAYRQRQQAPGGWTGIWATLSAFGGWSSHAGFFISPQSLIFSMAALRSQPTPHTNVERQQLLFNIERMIARAQHYPLTYYFDNATSVIHLAAARNHLDAVKALVKFESENQAAKNSVGDTALVLALKHGAKDVAAYLAECTPINIVNDAQETASLWAIKSRQLAIFDVLFQRGEDPLIRDHQGMNVYYYLIRQGEYARYIHCTQNTPAHHRETFKLFPHDEQAVSSATLAAYYGQNLIVAYLRDHGVFVSQKTLHHGIPIALYHAIVSDDLFALDGYLKYKHSLDNHLMPHLSVCLQIATQNRSMHWLNALKPLANASHWPLLVQSAVKQGDLDFIEQTLQLVTHRNVCLNPQGHTIAHLVVQQGLAFAIPILHGFGVDFSIPTPHETTFSLAIKADDYKCLKQLLNLDQPSQWPDHLLSLAIIHHSTRCLTMLQKRHDDLTTNARVLAIQSACQTESLALFNDLLERDTYTPTALGTCLRYTLGKKSEYLQRLLRHGAHVDSSLMRTMIKGQHIASILALHQAGLGHPLRALMPTTKNAYVRAAINNHQDALQRDIERLQHAEEFHDLDGLDEILRSFPFNTVFIDQQPFLHRLFALPMAADEHFDVQVLERLKQLKRIKTLNPLLLNPQGENLIQIIAHLTSNREKIRKFKLLYTMMQEHFATQIPALLSRITPQQEHNIAHLPLGIARLAISKAWIPLVDPFGHPLLLDVMDYQDKTLVNAIVNRGQSIDVRSKTGQTALMLAAADANLAFIRFLVEDCGADPNLLDQRQENALCKAIKAYKTDIALYLIDITTSLNHITRSGQNALMMAMIADDRPVAEALLPHITDLNCLDRKGWSAMHYAAMYAATPLLRLLLDHGATLDHLSGLRYKTNHQRAQTPLHTAIFASRVDNVRYLLQRGADIQLKDEYDQSALCSLAANPDPNLYAILLRLPEHNDPAIQTDLFLSAVRGDHLALTQALSQKISINSTDSQGLHALHTAAMHESNQCAAFLIQAGCDCEPIDHQGNTPLHYAAHFNACTILHMLKDQPINPHRQNSQGETALYLACKNGHIDAVSLLLTMGAQPAIAANNGLTSAQIALIEKQIPVATFLFILGDLSLFEESFQIIHTAEKPAFQALLLKLNQALLDVHLLQRRDLHVAVTLRHAHAIQFICASNPTLRLQRNDYGQSPQDLAHALGLTEMATFLGYFQPQEPQALLYQPATPPTPATANNALSRPEILTVLSQHIPLMKTGDAFDFIQALEVIAQQVWAERLSVHLANLSVQAQQHALYFLQKYFHDEQKSNTQLGLLKTFNSITHGSSTRFAYFDQCIFSAYPWQAILFNDGKHNALFFEIINLMGQHACEVLDQWFIAYFKPIEQDPMTPQQWQQALPTFLRFLSLLTNEPYLAHLSLLSPPPRETIAFRTASDYLLRVNQVLEHAQSPEQLRWLNQCPTNIEPLHLITQAMVWPHQGAYQHYKAHTLKTDLTHRYDTRITLFNALDKANLTGQKKIMLAQSILRHAMSGPFDERWSHAAVNIGEKVSTQWRDAVFYRLFTAKSSLNLAQLIQYIDQLFTLQKRQALDNAAFAERLRQRDLSLSSQEITTLYQREIIASIPDESIQTLQQRFLTPSDVMRFPLSTPEWLILVELYKKILVHGDTLNAQDPEFLAHTIQTQGAILAQNPSNQDASTHLLAAIRAMVLHQRKIYLYDTQILTLLATINYPSASQGRILQVRTGEGKSTLVAMLAAYCAAMGECVDVITSSRPLALRDQKEFFEFFNAMGITTSSISRDEPCVDDFRGRIIYGTSFDFEFSLMREALYENKARFVGDTSRPCDVVIVDEADNLFLDSAFYAARLTTQSDYDMSWVYPPIFIYVQRCLMNQDPLYLEELEDLLNTYQEGRHQSTHAIWSPHLLQWGESALLAIRKQEGVDYLVTPKTKHEKAHITIIDYENTGRKHSSTRWNDGLHEFLEVKHQLTPENEHLSASSMAHAPFFQSYKRIYGYTGTIGQDQERDEIRTTYHVDLYDIPPHACFRRTEEPATFCFHVRDYHAAMIQSAQAKIAQGRPVLIICQTIRESNEILHLCQQAVQGQPGIIQVLNEEQRACEDYILWNAGKPGCLTIATNAAGRGTDILLSNRSVQNGGLHVILAFFAVNTRVEDQAMGRAGRQGQPGSCELMIHADDPHVVHLIPDEVARQALDPRIAITTLKTLRQAATDALSHRRMAHTQKEVALHHIVEQFCRTDLTDIRAQIRSAPSAGILAYSLFIHQPNRAPVSCLESDIQNNQATASTYLRSCHLIEAQEHGHTVDWAAFIDACRDVFIQYTIQRWAITYTSIQHADSMSLQDMQSQFALFMTQTIEPIKSDAVKTFNDFVCGILESAFMANQHTSLEASTEAPHDGYETDQEQEQALQNDTQDFLLEHLQWPYIEKDVAIWRKKNHIPGQRRLDSHLAYDSIRNNMTFFNFLSMQGYRTQLNQDQEIDVHLAVVNK